MNYLTSISIATTRRDALRAALPLLALPLAGCSIYFGPAATPEGMARLQPSLLPEDGALEFSTGASFVNLRLQPTIGEALLLGARNDPLMGVVALTENSLILAIWEGEPRGYQVAARIPYREIVAIGPFGRTAVEVETNVPRHTPLGGPPRTGLYRLLVDTRQVIETLRRRAPQARPNPQ